MQTQKELIDKFLNCRRIAVVGVSRNPNDFSRKIWEQFRTRGYDAIPVHFEQTAIDGVRCFSNVHAISPAPECALILVSKERTLPVLEDCSAAGVRSVWIYGIRGEKDVSSDALRWCKENGFEVIAGHCPFMFLPDMALFHRFHGAVWKMLGYYPH